MTSNQLILFCTDKSNNQKKHYLLQTNDCHSLENYDKFFEMMCDIMTEVFSELYVIGECNYAVRYPSAKKWFGFYKKPEKIIPNIYAKELFSTVHNDPRYDCFIKEIQYQKKDNWYQQVLCVGCKDFTLDFLDLFCEEREYGKLLHVDFATLYGYLPQIYATYPSASEISKYGEYAIGFSGELNHAMMHIWLDTKQYDIEKLAAIMKRAANWHGNSVLVDI